MTEFGLGLVVVLLLLGSLLLLPLGLPGIWIMVAVLLGPVVAGTVSWATWAILVALAGAAELGEWVLVGRMSQRYGGSSRAFWGAVVGGLGGVFVGVPVPLVGPLIAGVAGTFAGAAAVTLWETRSWDAASRVGWGTSLARILAVGMKTGVGIVVIVLAGLALVL